MVSLGVPVWEFVVAAFFAPVAVWLLWRLQTVAVDLLRRRMLKLLRHFTWLYNGVSWVGTLIHELSHAVVLLLSGHGIRQFSVKTDRGHVTPRRVRHGTVGFLSFLVAALAPLFLPAAAILVAAVVLLEPSLMPTPSAGVGLRAASDAFTQTFVTFPAELGAALVQLDLWAWQGALLLAVILVAMPGSRPSHVKKSRFHGEDDEGDIAVVRRRLRQNPWPLVAFLLLLAVSYWALVPFWPRLYWVPLAAVWAVSLTGIVLSLWGAVVWSMVAAWGRTRLLVAWLPLAAFIVIQAAREVVFQATVDGESPGSEFIGILNAAAFAICLALTMLLRVAAPSRRL